MGRRRVTAAVGLRLVAGSGHDGRAARRRAGGAEASGSSTGAGADRHPGRHLRPAARRPPVAGRPGRRQPAASTRPVHAGRPAARTSGGRGISSITERLLMTRLAISGNDRVRAVDARGRAHGARRTRSTASRSCGAPTTMRRLFLLMAVDSLAQIDELARAGPAAVPDRMGGRSAAGHASCRIAERLRERFGAAARSDPSAGWPIAGRERHRDPASGWRPVGPSATLCRRRSRS